MTINIAYRIFDPIYTKEISRPKETIEIIYRL